MDWKIGIYRRYFGYRSRANFNKSSKISPIFRCFYRFFGKFPDISYQSSPRTGYKICPIFLFFLFLKIKCYLVIWSWFAGKGCVLQPGWKIVDLGFVKFKSNGTTAKRPLKQIQKTQGAKEKQFFWFSLGGFEWIFSEIKRGWIFPEIEWGMDFLGNQTGVAKKIIITWLD